MCVRSTRHSLAFAAVLGIVAACTPGERQAAKTVLDAAGIACVEANALVMLPDDAARACNLAEMLIPVVRELVAKAALEHAVGARAVCRDLVVDAGAP